MERGARIAVVAPCGPSPAELIRAGVARVAPRYEVSLDERALLAEGFLAGKDEIRAASLIDALRDREVRAIWCTRGGYGATRLLERFGDAIEGALRENPKPIVGFSDVTGLHALWSKVGVRSIHGPMIARLGAPDAVGDAELLAVFEAIEGRTPSMRAAEVWAPGAFEGRATGGNLAVLAALVGTPHAPRWEGAVVFLEDVGERPYRVDRLLTQLRAAGAAAGAAGFVLGDFTDCGPGPDGRTVEDVLREGLGPLGVPVVAGAPFGHGPRCAPFELGAPVRVDEGGLIEWPAAP